MNKHLLKCMMIALLVMSLMLLPLPLWAQGQDAQQASIAADLAAGTDIAVIIKNALAAGMTVEEAVEAIVTAGADPGRVVYIAITANYSAEAVVQGATAAVSKMGLTGANFQAAVTVISSAALQAGATQSQVTAGARNAGVSTAIISNAITQALMSPAPVFGYTAPTPPPTTAVVLGTVLGAPGGATIIGGSAIGAPPTPAATGKASPYKP